MNNETLWFRNETLICGSPENLDKLTPYLLDSQNNLTFYKVDNTSPSLLEFITDPDTIELSNMLKPYIYRNAQLDTLMIKNIISKNNLHTESNYILDEIKEIYTPSAHFNYSVLAFIKEFYPSLCDNLTPYLNNHAQYGAFHIEDYALMNYGCGTYTLDTIFAREEENVIRIKYTTYNGIPIPFFCSIVGEKLKNVKLRRHFYSLIDDHNDTVLEYHVKGIDEKDLYDQAKFIKSFQSTH